MDNEPTNMLQPAQLNRAAQGMHARLRGALPDVRIAIVDNVMQFIYGGATVQILADAYWKNQHMICWTVSVTAPGGHTHAWPETTNIDRALMYVGQAM
jgi:hypothetical protein